MGLGRRKVCPSVPTHRAMLSPPEGQGPGQYKATDDPKVLRGGLQIRVTHTVSVCRWLQEEPCWLSEEDRPPCPLALARGRTRAWVTPAHPRTLAGPQPTVCTPQAATPST